MQINCEWLIHYKKTQLLNGPLVELLKYFFEFDSLLFFCRSDLKNYI